MRIAITTDWLTSFGGAERVLQELHELYPSAPIFTSVLDRRSLPESTRDWHVQPSLLQRLPMVPRYSRALLPLMPAVFSRLDLSGYDVVLTTSSAFAKGVTVAPGAVNVCYCHTPPRYLWDLRESYTPGIVGLATSPAVRWLRARDREAAARVHHFIANSRTTAARITRSYGRASRVVHPPVRLERIAPSGKAPEDFFLVVSRLVRYKRIDLAVEACTRLGQRLIVVGDGPERRRLEQMAGSSVRFTGILGDADVASLYARSRAFLFPGLEDFGIAPVEAQAAGRPVIAFGAGGATETVVPNITGLFFEEQSCQSLIEAIERLARVDIDSAACRTNAERFDAENFRAQIAAVVAEAYSSGSRP